MYLRIAVKMLTASCASSSLSRASRDRSSGRRRGSRVCRHSCWLEAAREAAEVRSWARCPPALPTVWFVSLMK